MKTRKRVHVVTTNLRSHLVRGAISLLFPLGRWWIICREVVSILWLILTIQSGHSPQSGMAI